MSSQAINAADVVRKADQRIKLILIPTVPAVLLNLWPILGVNRSAQPLVCGSLADLQTLADACTCNSLIRIGRAISDGPDTYAVLVCCQAAALKFFD